MITIKKPERIGRRLFTALLSVVTMTGMVGAASADDAVKKGIEQYREMLQDANPAELTVYKGEDLWLAKAGPKQASLEACDLGKGPGVLEGAYAELPRYFADTDKVMDAESRIAHCRVTLQGLSPEEAANKPFGGRGQPQTTNEALVAYVVEQSRGVTINVPQAHPKEVAAYKRGEKSFFYAAGPYDFSCATCHAKTGQRIRLQDLPNLVEPEAAKKAFASWPAYRVSLGLVKTMQWRMNDCFRQQRFPKLKFGSQTSIDLITYMGVKAKGGTMNAPALKR
ncbi:MAG: sulfur oxidation c-type cytochrome SoxA [Burkholderiaceae bacterium]